MAVTRWLTLVAVSNAHAAGASDPNALSFPTDLPPVAGSMTLPAPEEDTPTPPGGGPRGGRWAVSAGASGTLTLTNNVNLAPASQRQADAVLGLSVPLAIRREGARVKVNADYTPTAYLYASTRESDNLQNNLRSQLSIEALEDFFFVDASANIYQTYISPFLPRPESGASATPNRTQQTTLGLSPYIRHQGARGWSYLVRNDNYWNTYSEQTLGNSVSSRISADAKSPPARLSYGLDYTYLYTRDDSQPTAYYQQIARVRPIWRASRQLAVSARLGYESNDYVTQDSGPVYGAGIDWAPSPRTKLNGFVEHRFFGTSYGVDFNHRTRRTVWKLNATRNTYTTIEQPLTLRPGTTAEVLDDALRSRIQDPVQREEAVSQFLARAGLPPSLTEPYSFYTNQIYLAQQVSGSVGFVGRRNTAELRLFWQDNQPITTSGDLLPGVFFGFNRLRQRGVTLTLSRRLSGFTSLTFVANRLYSLTADPRFSFATDEVESIEDTLRLTLTHQLSPKSDGSIGVRWANFDSVVSPYQELAVFATVAHSF